MLFCFVVGFRSHADFLIFLYILFRTPHPHTHILQCTSIPFSHPLPSHTTCVLFICCFIVIYAMPSDYLYCCLILYVTPKVIRYAAMPHPRSHPPGLTTPGFTPQGSSLHYSRHLLYSLSSLHHYYVQVHAYRQLTFVQF